MHNQTKLQSIPRVRCTLGFVVRWTDSEGEEHEAVRWTQGIAQELARGLRLVGSHYVRITAEIRG